MDEQSNNNLIPPTSDYEQTNYEQSDYGQLNYEQMNYEEPTPEPKPPKNRGGLVRGLLAGLAGGVIVLLGFGTYSAINSGFSSLNNSISTPTVTKTTYNVQTDTTKAIQAVSNAVVSVLNYQSGGAGTLGGGQNSQPAGQGSGVIYKKSGNTAFIITNNHVVAGNQSLEVLLASGERVSATVVGADASTDIAVLKIDATNVKQIATFGDSSKLNVGEPAIAVGSPLGSDYANTATEGIVSSLSRPVTLQNDSGQTVSTNAIQTDAAINPGNSGGALINIKGQVIGITSSKISAISEGGQPVTIEGMGFAIPANDAMLIANKLETTGKAERPSMGIQVMDFSQLSSDQIKQLNLPSNVNSGAVVASVQGGSAAATAGLKQNDVIVKLDNTPINSFAALQSTLYRYSVGGTAQVTFYRGSTQHTVTIRFTTAATTPAAS